MEKKTEDRKTPIRIKVWMLRNKAGQFLCYGNPNPRLRYHFSFPFNTANLEKDRFCFCENRWMARNLAKDANDNFLAFSALKSESQANPKRFAEATHVKPVEMEIVFSEVSSKGRKSVARNTNSEK